MDYHLNYLGKDLGRYPIEELQRRRAAGEFTGQELAWCPGMETWQPLDSVLKSAAGNNPASTPPPPLPQPAGKSNSRRNLILITVAGVILLAAAVVASLSGMVNGKKIFSGATAGSIWGPENQFLVGLGAYNDSNETVIRYRNVKLRKITGSGSTGGE